MNVRNILSSDEIASSVLTFSGQREVNESVSIGPYIAHGSVTCFKSWNTHGLCIAHIRAYLYKE